MTTLSVARRDLYTLQVRDDGMLVDAAGDRFDVEAYSRFKYGQADTGRQYGLELARVFANSYPETALCDDKIVVSGPSYKYLSTASHGIVRHFCTALNAFRVLHGFEPVYELHSIRSTVGTDAYAMGDAALRATHLAKSEYHIDGEMVRDSRFVFIDDVNITGATEQRTLDRIAKFFPKEIFCLHVASIDPDYAATNAAIENTMNKTVPLSLANLLDLMRQNNFRLNTRVFRSIMEWRDADELRGFLSAIDDGMLIEMLAAIVGGTVEMYDRFPEATRSLVSVLRERGLYPEVVA